MSITMYEPIALYDYERCKQDLGEDTITTVILHADMAQMGVCTCNKEGVRLLGQTRQQAEKSLYEGLMSRLAAALTEKDIKVVEDQWEVQVEGMNPLVKRCLCYGMQNDKEAFGLYSKNVVLKVSQLKQIFEDIMDKWNRALEEGCKLLDSLMISVDDVRILVVGNLAKCYFAEYTAKSCLSGSPLLPDDRFADYIQKEDVSRLIQSGEDIFRSKSMVGHEIILRYWDCGQDGSGAERTHLLASARQPVQELAQAVYWEGLLVEKEEGIALSVDGKVLKVDLPYMLAPEAADKIDVALKAVDRKLLLSIRRTEMPAKVYDISLEKYGIGKEQA